MSNNPNPYVEPIPQKTTVALINLVVLRFSDFLNKFYSETEEKLLNLEKRIGNLDTVLLLLEKKLDSVPQEFFNNIPAANYANDHLQEQAQNIAQASEPQQQEYPQAAPVEIDEADREIYLPFIKAFKVGVPFPAIRAKMVAAGIDPSGIEKYIDINPDGQPQDSRPQPVPLPVPQSQRQQPVPPPVQAEDLREKYEPFIKMHKVGVPLPAIKAKLAALGLDPNGLDKYIELKPENQQQEAPAPKQEEQREPNPPAQQQDELPAEDDREQYEPFIRAFKVGVPFPAIRAKMVAAGIDPAGIEKYIDLNQG